MGGLFCTVIALWTIYYLGFVILQMPLPFVLVLACIAVVCVLVGIGIGIWILANRARKAREKTSV